MLGISHRAGGFALHAGSGWSWLSMMPVAAIHCLVKYYITAQKRHGEGTSGAAHGSHKMIHMNMIELLTL